MEDTAGPVVEPAQPAYPENPRNITAYNFRLAAERVARAERLRGT